MSMDSPDLGKKPAIIVVAESIMPDAGSEPGKGWWWTSALSEYFKLHIITQEHYQSLCMGQPIVAEHGWTFHPTPNTITTWRFGVGYYQYAKWLNLALEKAREIASKNPVIGLCHVTIGSFRVMPAYHRLGLPYTIGPLGGGEFAPAEFLRGRPVPLSHRWVETLRPRLNESFSLIPQIRACMKSAALVTVTSEETGKILQKMGARNLRVVFPDSYDYPINIDQITAARGGQTESVRNEIRLLWQGRPLWWKTPDLALMLLKRALECGVRVRLSLVGPWKNAVGDRLRALAGELGIADHVEFIDPMPRREFLALAAQYHGFLATSLHDSGGIPLIEAQAQGLPCFTLGLGGNRQAACPEAGVGTGISKEEFFSQSIACLQAWQANPSRWLEESKKAVQFSTQFNRTRLHDYVRDLIVPAFNPGIGSRKA